MISSLSQLSDFRPRSFMSTESGEWSEEVDIGGVSGGLWSGPIGGEMEEAFMLSGLKPWWWWWSWWWGWRLPPKADKWWGGLKWWGYWWGCPWWWAWWSPMSRGLRISWIRSKPLAHIFILLAKLMLRGPDDGSFEELLLIVFELPLPTNWFRLGCIFWTRCIGKFTSSRSTESAIGIMSHNSCKNSDRCGLSFY